MDEEVRRSSEARDGVLHYLGCHGYVADSRAKIFEFAEATTGPGIIDVATRQFGVNQAFVSVPAYPNLSSSSFTPLVVVHDRKTFLVYRSYDSFPFAELWCHRLAMEPALR